jgi:tetratricopeptide (TPR) repeat protein
LGHRGDKEDDAARASLRRREAGAAAALVLATSLAYVPALRGGFVWDDDFYVTNNRTLSEPGGLRRIWFEVGATPQYYPLVFTSFWVERRLWGDHPTGYHAVNVLLHAASAVVLWRVLRRLALPGAWLAAAVFAVHPVHVESVAWVTERKNVLSGFFYLLALWAYLRFEAGAVRQPGAWAASLGLFACALLSKTITASLPAVIVLLLWWRRGRLARSDAAALAPMFILGAVMGLTTAWLEAHHVGARGEEWDLSAAERCLVAGRAAWFYLGKLVWPAGLTFIYPRWTIDAGDPAAWLWPAASVAALGGMWLARGRIGRGPAAAGLCFVGTLAPALGFFNVYPFRYSFVADHFQYLASIAVIAPAIGLASARLAGRQGGRAAGVAAGTILLVVLGVLTWRQGAAYQDMESLWRDTLRKNPGAWMAHGNLGDHLCDQGRYEEAAGHYRESLRLRPHSEQVHFNLGIALDQLGRPAEAVESYRRALDHKPLYPQAHINIGCALLKLGRMEEAAASLRAAVAQDAELPEAHYNLGNALAAAGRYAEARAAFAAALRLRPDHAEARINDANALVMLGRAEEAIAGYQAAARLAPANAEARLNLGSLLLQKGRAGEAAAELARAVELRPDSFEGLYRLGLALQRSGRGAEAAARFRAALALRPGDAACRQALEAVAGRPVGSHDTKRETP